MLLRAGLLTAGWVWCLSGLRAPTDGGASFLLVATAVWLEFVAPRSPSGPGFLSTAFSAYLALAIVAGTAWSALGSALILGARWALRASGSARERWDGFWLDAAPSVSALCAFKLASSGSWWGNVAPVSIMAGLLASALHLAVRTNVAGSLARALPDPSGFDRCRARTQYLIAMTGPLGVCLAASVQPLSWSLALAAAALALQGRSIQLELGRVHSESVLFLQEQLSRQSREVGQTRERVGELRRDLHAKVEDFSALEDFSRVLMGLRSECQVLDTALARVRLLVPCQSAVVFLAEEGGLVPAAYLSPHVERLESARLLKLQDSLVADAWRMRRALTTDRARPSELFPDEPQGFAVPVGDLGVLYVGCAARQALPDRAGHLLGILADHTALAIRSARWIELQQRELERHARAHTFLRDWVEGLDRLLEAIRDLLSSLDREVVLDRLCRATGELTAARRCLVVLEGRVVRDTCPGPLESQSLAELTGSLLGNQRPLWLEDLQTSRYRGAFPAAASLAAVPLGTRAVLMALDTDVSRQELHFMAILGYQAAIALENTRLHQELRQAYATLKESQAELVESRKVGAIGQLAAGVAHEVNTPLCAALLAIDRTARKWPECRTVLDRARADISRAQQIVEKLLYYSRDARTGRVTADLNQIVRDSLDMVRPEYARLGIQVETRYAEGVDLECNQAEIQQVLLNLLDNARTAVSERPEKRISVSTRREGDRVVLSVRDTGPGVSPEIAERIFEPFFTTHEVGDAVGLGLAVSQQLVRSHGGILSLEPPEGRGAGFRVELPVEGAPCGV
ncbi:MAG: GAF domain-containing sensor histidine kinase [Candidatus Eremiobacterota bacterium]